MSRTGAFVVFLVVAGMQSSFGQTATAPRQAPVRAAFTPVPAAASLVTRGIGIYPGDPREDFAPTSRIDSTTYRNLARLRPAYHSSSYDYNLTAQLITDGIVETAMPRRVVVATWQQGLISTDVRDLPGRLAPASLSGYSRQQRVWPKHQREWPMDDNWVTGFQLRGPRVWVQFGLHGGAEPLAIDEVRAVVRVEAGGTGPENWTCTVLGSDDGEAWTPLGHTSGMSVFGGDILPVARLAELSRHRHLRVVFDNPRALQWHIGEIAFRRGGVPVRVGGPHQFSSAWTSAGQGVEWVYVDLGAPCTFDRIVLRWLARPSDAVLQVSEDATAWRDVQALAAAPGNDDDLKLKTAARGRYVRVLMKKPAGPDGYVLTEMEVHGRGGPVPVARPLAPARADGRADLAGGRWRLQRDSLVTADGAALSTPGFKDEEWVVATVPATVLSSYWNAGALPDPNFGDNQLMISDAFFHADFWYRTEFEAPAAAAGRRHWLNFDGVNLNADVFLNGERIGRIEGAFTRARFDVTARLHAGAPNALALRVEKPTTPGSVKEKTFEHPDKNGGGLGLDNPTYHASIGWDWIPTIRGRNTGIWNDVYLTVSGAVTIGDPSVTTTLPLPDTTRADVRITTDLRNHDAAPVSGRLRGRFGDVTFDVPVTVPSKGAQVVTLDPANVPGLRMANPRLWWPNGYGEQHLYDVELAFEAGGTAASDAKRFKAGVRQFTHSFSGGTLRMWINGRRFVPRGGNWGFPESMLRYRGREYDVAVRYHKDLNFNMIRNWVGQTGDDEFYEACDRHGIVVWQDFWLANPWDGPDPANEAVFMANAADMVGRIRAHPSVGLYCGRNEGYPPKPLDDALRTLLAERHGDVPYISSSADDVASGHGPYRAMPIDHYFLRGATPKIHSEMGMPNIMTIDSLKAMLPERALWPLGNDYGLHDFSLDGAQGGASFLERIQKSYGAATSAAEWSAIAQFVNYEGYRAMYEAQSRHRMGLLIWMSHPAWPSLVWQTYDYYFEPTAAYFGAKKAAEPLHVQWNPTTEAVEVVNYNAGAAPGLTASAEVRNIDGSLIWEKSAAVDSKEDSTLSVIEMEYPLGASPVHFIRLKLTRGADVVSENFYWRGLENANFLQLRELPKVPLEAATTVSDTEEGFRLTTELYNGSDAPAIMVRLKAVRATSGDRILPALFSDNYVALMPGERRTVTTGIRREDARGEPPRMVVEGFNVGEVRYRGASPVAPGGTKAGAPAVLSR
jgi:hypothetical protein